MRLNPVRSIILGFVVFVLVFLFFIILGREKTTILLFLSFFLGGFIAMYFVREKKSQYLFYEGILIFIFSIIMYPTIMPRLSVFGFIYLFLFILIFTGIGGFIGNKIAEKIVEKKIWSFNPVISISLGLIVSYIVFVLLFNLTMLGNLDSVFHQIWIVEEVCSLVIGGFIATYFAKEKKIQFGIYLGITWAILIGLIPSLIFFDFPTSLLELITVILRYIVYIIAPITGSYLAILIVKHQKLST
jgi:general stress protein CsbA